MVQRPPAGTIPDKPGSYQFMDAEGRVIYVGKAKSLRSRLSNYFQTNLHPRTAQMVATTKTCSRRRPWRRTNRFWAPMAMISEKPRPRPASRGVSTLRR